MISFSEALQVIKYVAAHLSEERWAAGSGGNISIRIPIPPFINEITQYLTYKKTFLDHNPFPALVDHMLVVTASGSSMTVVASNPIKNIVVCNFNNNNIEIFSSKENSLPTSEWKSHFSIHEMLVRENKKSHIVVHSHIPTLIAFSHHRSVRKIKTQQVNRILYSMLPELLISLPEGLGLIPFYLPGSEELAKETVEVFKTKTTALWINHGIIAHGDNSISLIERFTLLEAAVQIYLSAQQLSKSKPYLLKENTIKKLKEIFSSYPRK